LAVSTPCCREAEGLEALLVLRVYRTAVFERRHFLARLVVIILRLAILGTSGLDFAERSAFGLAS
jgi:hypothetical protein